jgi:hypothetical protein
VEDFLSKDKGDTYDEFCISGAINMVLGSCIRWFVYSVNGSICALTTWLVFNINTSGVDNDC